MPLPMVHLAVAVDLAQMGSIHLTDAFLLGSLAPDAIHMRAGTNRSDKNRTHLLDAPHSDTIDEIYMAAIGEFVQQHRQADAQTTTLIAGWAAHLLTDRLWFKTVYQQFCQQVPQTLSPVERTHWYYQETEQVDRALYEQMSWTQTVWMLLANAPPLAVEPLLTATEIAQYTMQKQVWYTTPAPDYNRQPQFITIEQVHHFIPYATACIADQFKQLQSLV